MIYRNLFDHLNTTLRLLIIPLLLTSCNLGNGDVWTDPPVPVSSVETFDITYDINGDVVSYNKNTYYKRSGNLESEMEYTGAGTDGEWMTPDDSGVGSFYLYDDQDRVAYGLEDAHPGADGKWLTVDDVVFYAFSARYEGDSEEATGYMTFGIPDGSGGWIGVPGPDGIWFSGDEPIIGTQIEMDDPVVPNQKLLVVYLDPGGDTDWRTPDDIPSLYFRELTDNFGNKLHKVLLDDPGGDGILFNSDDRTFDPNGAEYASYRYDALSREKYVILSSIGADNIPVNLDDPITSYIETQYLPNGKINRLIGYDNEGADTYWFTSDDLAYGTMNYIYNGQNRLVRRDGYVDGGDDVMPSGDDIFDMYALYSYGENNILTRIQSFDNNDILTRDQIYEYTYEKGAVTTVEKPELF